MGELPVVKIDRQTLSICKQVQEVDSFEQCPKQRLPNMLHAVFEFGAQLRATCTERRLKREEVEDRESTIVVEVGTRVHRVEGGLKCEEIEDGQ